MYTRLEKLGNTEDESERSTAAWLILHNSDTEGRTGRKSWGDKEKK
jgi:hypothetical protein